MKLVDGSSSSLLHSSTSRPTSGGTNEEEAASSSRDSTIELVSFLNRMCVDTTLYLLEQEPEGSLSTSSSAVPSSDHTVATWGELFDEKFDSDVKLLETFIISNDDLDSSLSIIFPGITSNEE